MKSINIRVCYPFGRITEGKPIPTELRKDEAELRKAIEFDDEKHESEWKNLRCVLVLSQRFFFVVYLGPCSAVSLY